MFLKLNMSLIPHNLTNVVESPVWNTLIPSRHELLDDIDDFDDNENEEDDDDLSQVPIKSDETNYMCWFQAFQFP